MERTTQNIEGIPPAIGPYSHGVFASGRLFFTSGQLGLTADGNFAGDDVETQTRQACTNLRTLLESAGMSFGNVVKTTIFLKDMNDFPVVNKVYAEFVGDDPPARSTVEVARLPKDGLVEIEAIAVG
ncbi:MAG: Rid family detoxifying hydrolase [Fimbriimonadales bacterium]